MPRPTRTETDAFGPIEVAADALWGAQTQRSLHHFAISTERMPVPLIRALAEVKRACARVNGELGLLPADKAAAIIAAADEVLAELARRRFPGQIVLEVKTNSTDNPGERLQQLAIQNLYQLELALAPPS
mgnify:CR=1 FL=1